MLKNQNYIYKYIYIYRKSTFVTVFIQADKNMGEIYGHRNTTDIHADRSATLQGIVWLVSEMAMKNGAKGSEGWQMLVS